MNDTETQNVLIPQTQAAIAAGDGVVIVRTDDSKFLVLTSDLAIDIGGKLAEMGKISKQYHGN